MGPVETDVQSQHAHGAVETAVSYLVLGVALHQAYGDMAGNEARTASYENMPGHKLAGVLLGHHGWSPRRAALPTLTEDL